MNNKTTTETKIAKILEHEHSRSFCRREIMQVIAKERKAVLEKAIAIAERSDVEPEDILDELYILAQSQEEREEK